MLYEMANYLDVMVKEPFQSLPGGVILNSLHRANIVLLGPSSG